MQVTGQLHVPAALMLEKGTILTLILYIPLRLISKQRKVPNRLTQIFVFRKRLEVHSMRSRVPVEY